MSRKKIIAIEGKTSSGKDTAAKYLNEKYNIPMVVSVTTRPKRAYETNGKEHYFVSKQEMAKTIHNNTVIAYTKNDITGIEYCATLEALQGDINVYIINPDGVRWLKEHNKDNLFDLTVIYIDLPEEEIIQRGRLRGDNEEILQTRLASERNEFDTAKANKEYDYYICNSKDQQYLYDELNKIMKNITI
jgi:guanylate kinase